jgi:ABC-type Mn2+/Zn2+ transport system permease subunit
VSPSGALTSLSGAYASYFLDGADGGIIVVLQTDRVPRLLFVVGA